MQDETIETGPEQIAEQEAIAPVAQEAEVQPEEVTVDAPVEVAPEATETVVETEEAPATEEAAPADASGTEETAV